MSDINKLSFTISGQATSAYNALKKLSSGLNDLNVTFTKTASSGEQFVSVLGQISGFNSTVASSMKGVTTNNKKMATAVSGTTSKIKTNSVALNTQTTRLSKLNSVLTTNTLKNKSNTSSLSSMIKKITQISFVVYSLRTAIRALNVGTQNAIAYVENLNLFMVALGENTTRATGFITEMADSLYLDEAQLTRVQGLFYQISESLGLSSEKAYTLSENFTKLAYDLASFYNLTVDEAVTKLQAGLVGETEPLRRIGIIITENNLAETARNLGITKSIRNMTEQEKIQLRYITALQQTQNAQSDLARTMEQPENLLRIMKQQFTKLGREIGNTFIPAIKRIVPEIIGMVIALTNLAKKLAELAGYEDIEISDDLGGYSKVVEATEEADENTSSVASNLRSALTTVRQLSTSTTGIDELNILGETSTFDFTNLFDVTEVTEATEAIDEALSSYNNGMEETNGVFDDIVEKWQIRMENLISTLKTSFSDTSEALSELFDVLFDDDNTEILIDIKDVLDFIDGVLSTIISDITTIIKKTKELWEEHISPLLGSEAPEWFASLDVENLVKIVARIMEISIALNLLGSSLKTLTVAGNVITFFTKLITLVPYLGSIGYAIGLATTLFNIIKDTMELFENNSFG